MPISLFTLTGFYYSTLVYLLSAVFLVAIYNIRWKSDLVSLCVWSVGYLTAAVFAWYMTQDLYSLGAALGINFILILIFSRMMHIVSFFGVCFSSSLLLPAIYGVIWLGQLTIAAIHYLDAPWYVNTLFVVASCLLAFLSIFNTSMSSWVNIARFSPLFFRFPRLKRGWEIANGLPDNFYPMISIHVPAYNEPPEMVIESLNALAKLDYPHFEVILIDNNTQDPAIWKPLEEHCKTLGERFRFYHFDQLKGAKAGALNTCIKLTSPKAELIGLIDADYIVQPDYLKKLVGFFKDPKTGFVQAAQDYHRWEDCRFKTACYYEYEVHFKLELSGLNEWDVCYTIGTMCLIRRNVLEQIGGWSEWCLTEDSEVSVRVHAAGYSGYYLIDTLGKGLIPETYENYKQQRFRWSAGPAQQIQKNWPLYLPKSWGSKGVLNPLQKIAEINHSLSVLFNEVLTFIIGIPLLVISLWYSIEKGHTFIVPYIVLFFVLASLIRSITTNYLAVRLMGGNWKNYIQGVIASRSLILTRNTGYCKAWLSSKLKWIRTDKFKTTSSFSRAFYSSKSEMIASLIYLSAVIALFPFISIKKPDLIFFIWLGLLGQSLTYLCGPIMAIISERSLAKDE